MWDKGDRMSVLLAAFLVSTLSLLSVIGINTQIDNWHIGQSLLLFLAIWFVVLVAFVTPARLWAQHRRTIAGLNRPIRVPRNRDSLVSVITDVENAATDYLTTLWAHVKVERERSEPVQPRIKDQWNEDLAQKRERYRAADLEFTRQKHIAGRDFEMKIFIYQAQIQIAIDQNNPDFWSDEDQADALSQIEKDGATVTESAKTMRDLIDTGGLYFARDVVA